MNVLDYIKMRGDLSFKISPFNEVDNLLLSILAYVNLTGIVPTDEKTVTIKEASDCFFEEMKAMTKSVPDGFMDYAPQVMKQMALSRRFGNLRLHNEKTLFDKKETCQFSALTIDLDNRTSYIAFRGTDDTLVGWKEDFEISYKVTNAQELALKYLEENGRGFFHKYMVGGHSKGGNLAQYAASKCSEKVKKKLIAIYSNDGPGISDKLFVENEYAAIKDRYIKIVPYFDIIGCIFDESDSNIIVKSDEIGIMQHSGLSWQVEGDHFVRSERYDDTSYLLMKEFNEALDELSLEQYEVFSNEIFKALYEAGISKADEMIESVPTIIKVLNNLAKMDTTAKGVAEKLLKAVVEAAGSRVKKIISNKKGFRNRA